MSAAIAVEVSDRGGGWLATVSVDDDGHTTQHTVTVDRAYLGRIASGRDPEDVVRASFVFLLEREPASAILREFDLPVIGRYFPEYEAAMKTRFGGK